MLPILPALLLLLLNAPTKMDRVVGLKAIGALETLHRKLEGGSRPVAVATAEDTERAWASLLALPLAPADLEAAFATLLGLHAVADEAALPLQEDGPRVVPPRPSPPLVGDLEDGWLACRRTRDGPVSR